MAAVADGQSGRDLQPAGRSVRRQFHRRTNEIAGTLIERNGASGLVDVGSGQRVEVALLQSIAAGEKIRIALRPEILRSASATAATPFNARVLDRRYQGTQTVYDIVSVRPPLEVLELGTAARHQVGVETPVPCRGKVAGLS